MRQTTSLLLIASLLSAPAFAQEVKAQRAKATEKPAAKKAISNDEAHIIGQEGLVSLSEQKAIDALERIIAKKKGKPEEADLQERLSELYLKQAKSVRFFALNKTGDNVASLLPPIVKEKTQLRPLQKAVAAFQRIQTAFPNFKNMDRVHFHKALTLAQMGMFKPSTQEVEVLLAKYPNSEWRPDAELLIGEVLYDSQEFTKALAHFRAAAAANRPKVSQYGQYKAAWALYNLKRVEDALEALKELVKSVDPENPQGFALRNESLRDMALFYTESKNADAAFEFFHGFSNEEEAANSLFRMAQIYRSHSQHKDARLISNEYIKKGTSQIGKIKFHLLMAQDSREQKRGDNQIEHLKAAFDLCQIQSPDEETCTGEFRTALNTAAEDWWKIWEKTKSPEHLKWTRGILEIEIQRNPDPRPSTLEAYAELLFQSNDFENSARVYRDLSGKVKDGEAKEKAMYGSLVSLDRWMEKDKNAILPKEFFKEEVAVYLKAHPKTKNREELTLKWASLLAEDQKWPETEKLLKDNLVQIPAQNLYLQALSAQKKDKEFSKALTTFIQKAPTTERRAELRRQEAKSKLEKLEDGSMAGDPKLLTEYMEFLNKYKKDDNVTEPVHWKTLALALLMNEDKIAFDLASDKMDVAAKDNRVWDSFKQILVRYDKTDAKKRPDQKKLFEAALKVAPAKERPQVLWSYREFLIGQKDMAAATKVENEIVASNQEPEKSLILVSRLEKDLDAGRFEKVFSETRPLVGQSKPPVVRARARLLQARILEKEFRDQRMKASFARLQLVVTLKLEKLAKAQEAYMSALQLSNDGEVIQLARKGLRRCMEHAIESLRGVEVKDELTAEEMQSLKEQIQTLISPLENQLQEIVKSEGEAKS